MDKYNILYLTENMDNYSGASYQKDVINSLSNKFEVNLYGPGYKNFVDDENLDVVLEKTKKDIKAIVFGHSFLSDSINTRTLQNFGNYSLNQINLPKIGILNKEYVNLEKKINFFKENKFDLCLTHHHLAHEYKDRTGVKFLFWPFATSSKFLCKESDKTIDVGFSGTLQKRLIVKGFSFGSSTAFAVLMLESDAYFDPSLSVKVILVPFVDASPLTVPDKTI